MSFPTRERGLKSPETLHVLQAESVVPHEGTWIEITKTMYINPLYRSFPTRERGLK